MKNHTKKKFAQRGIVVPRGQAATRTPIPGARVFKDRRDDARLRDVRRQINDR